MKEKKDVLKIVEAIANRNFKDFDSKMAPQILMQYMESKDEEVLLSVIRASTNYPHEEDLMLELMDKAESSLDEEIRAVSCGALGSVMQEGMDFDSESDPNDTIGTDADRELYETVKYFLLAKVDAPMESMEVRRRALESLGPIGFLPQIQKIILRFYHEAPNPFVKVSAIYAMGLNQNDLFERLVLEQLYSDNDFVLIEAIHSVANLDLQASEPRLYELAQHPNPEVKAEAISALGAIGNPPKVQDFINTLEINKDDFELKQAVSFAVNNLQQRKLIRSDEELCMEEKLWNEIKNMMGDQGAEQD